MSYLGQAVTIALITAAVICTIGLIANIIHYLKKAGYTTENILNIGAFSAGYGLRKILFIIFLWLPLLIIVTILKVCKISK